MKKKITIAVPIMNEYANIHPLYERTSAVCAGLTAYDYEIVFLMTDQRMEPELKSNSFV